MKPKVSVIIPCYNYQNYIEQCLMSVLLQRTNFKVEIIVSDDNSTDNSYNIIERIANSYQSEQFQFKIFRNEQNLREVNNTKKLIENCSGQYIAYLDADDYWIDPYKLQKQIEFLENNSDHIMCVTGFYSFDGEKYNPVENFSIWHCSVGELDSNNIAFRNNVSCSSSRVFRNTENLSQILFKDYAFKFPYSDWVINFELSFLGKIKYLNFPSYMYRSHRDSLSNTNTLDKNLFLILIDELEKRKTSSI
jgi:glycosyltransferase involved in cell wall biosynthesis